MADHGSEWEGELSHKKVEKYAKTPGKSHGNYCRVKGTVKWLYPHIINLYKHRWTGKGRCKSKGNMKICLTLLTSKLWLESSIRLVPSTTYRWHHCSKFKGRVTSRDKANWLVSNIATPMTESSRKDNAEKTSML